MADLKTKTVLVIDNGLFVEMAVSLSRSFGRTLYYSPWEGAFPTSNSMLIGEGVPGITRVNSFWNIIDDIDLFVFPDVYHGPLQVFLANRLGKRVWGGRMGEDLELFRDASKKHLAKLGIPIGPYKVVRGLDSLRDYLKANNNQYVKISRTRGDMETFAAKNYKLIEPKLDELEHKLGAKKKIMEFVVEAAIDNAVEIGYDGFTIDGQYARNAMWGIECKDEGLVAQATTYDKLPLQAREVNGKLSSTFAALKYRGFFSSEIRVTKDGTGYMIDPCARAGSPPSELYQMMVTNWADIIWNGAEGVLVEPKFAAPWGAELLLLSSWADKNWQAIEFPPAIRPHVKLRNLTIIEGRYYVVPQHVGLPEIGAVVALGSSMDQAISNVGRIAEQVKGYYVDVKASCLDTIKDEFAKVQALSNQTKPKVKETV
jgi:hypothetical protein